MIKMKIFLVLSLFIIKLSLLKGIIPYDGIIHRSSDGSSYAFLSPPRTGNHAASIEQMTPSGTLAIAWFTGGEGQPNTSIAVSLLERGSQQFTPGVIVSQHINYTNQNPVLFWDNQTQILHLFHSSQLAVRPGGYPQIWHLQSKDRGATWSTPDLFYSSLGSYDRNHILRTYDNNGLIFPCYNVSSIADTSFTLRLSSSTSQWTRININQTDNLIQPAIIRLNNSSRLRAFFRDQNAVSIYYADSVDDGLTWTIPKATSLPNNAAGIDAMTLKSGAVLIAFNNHNDSHRARSPLTVALSYDDGITWPYQKNIQTHDDDSENVGEYSYPSLVQTFWKGTDQNDIHLAYTYDRLTIKYIRFNEQWIKQKQLSI